MMHQIAIALESLCGDEKGILLDYNYDGRILDFTQQFNLLWMASLKVNLELILRYHSIKQWHSHYSELQRI